MQIMDENLIHQANAMRQRLIGNVAEDSIEQAKLLLKQLRDAREFVALADFAEEVMRRRPGDGTVARLYGQALIDTGKAALAEALLDSQLAALSDDDPEWAELIGLKGRATKQIFMDSADRTQDFARNALARAITAYAAPFEKDQASVWHGINLSACLHAATRHKVPTPGQPSADEVARRVLKTLEAWPDEKRDLWYHATLGEAHVALGAWDQAETSIAAYINDPKIKPFSYAGTLRQLRDVWEIQHDGPRGEALLQALETRLLDLVPNAGLTLRPDYIRDTLDSAAPSEPDLEHLEKVLGGTNAKTVRWYRTGLERTQGVGSVRRRLGGRFGTAFAVPASTFGLAGGPPVLALTNYHVVASKPELGRVPPETVEISFELAGSAGSTFLVQQIVSESRQLDYALLELSGDVSALATLPIAAGLPSVAGAAAEQARLYVIGHPRGDELHISFQDNHLLDHEGPPNGLPEIAERVRVHYHTPTEPGSSGSPVFDDNWDVVALHHAGLDFDPDGPRKPGYQRLNHKLGRYAANEGYWIQSIIAHARTSIG